MRDPSPWAALKRLLRPLYAKLLLRIQQTEGFLWNASTGLLRPFRRSPRARVSADSGLEKDCAGVFPFNGTLRTGWNLIGRDARLPRDPCAPSMATAFVMRTGSIPNSSSIPSAHCLTLGIGRFEPCRRGQFPPLQESARYCASDLESPRQAPP